MVHFPLPFASCQTELERGRNCAVGEGPKHRHSRDLGRTSDHLEPRQGKLEHVVALSRAHEEGRLDGRREAMD
jgi:hypothetical protein